MHKCPDGNQPLLWFSSVIHAKPCRAQAVQQQNPQRVWDVGEAAEFQAQPALMPHLKEMASSDLRLAASLGKGWKSFLLISTSALKNKPISYQSLAGDAAGREWQPVPRGKWKQGNAFQMLHLEFLPFPSPQCLASSQLHFLGWQGHPIYLQLPHL